MPQSKIKGNSMKFIKSTHLLAGVAALALTATMAPASFAQDAADHLAANKSSVHRADSLRSAGASKAAIADFIAAKRGTAIELVTDSEFNGRNGVSHLRMHQEIDGLRVHGSDIKAAISSEGRLVHLIERTARSDAKIVQSNLSADAAISRATDHNFGAGKKADFFHISPSAEKVLIARNSGTLEEGYLVQNWSESDNMLYHTLVDGRGKIVDNELRTADDSYNVYTDHPLVGAQTVINGPGTWLDNSSQTTRDISGNNAHAYLDRDNNNSSDGGGTAVTDGNFLATHFPGQEPTTSDNQDVAVQNLFYLNNRIHDDLYGHGFVESTRNFQENNFGLGGIGGDSVNAEAQDGGSTNNANFATPSDGSNPRMQMYLWTTTSPGRDGDLDSDIVWHEYGHGLTWRMIGSMSGSVSGAIGEGMGDVLAILHNNQPTVGEFSTNNFSRGIRSESYDGYSRTIGDFGGNSVHSDGEIYAATIWRLGELYGDNEGLMDILVDGMNFTPAGPGYLDMRDGILQAAPTADDCTVWQAFADFGMGEGASFSIRGRRASITESFSVPAACDGPPVSNNFDLGSLSGNGTNTGGNKWAATATATVAPVTQGVEIGYSWSTGASGSCTTDSNGSCSATLGGMRRNQVTSVNFTVNSFDGDTDFAGATPTITINRP
jgi:Zn-dependent metalloprotease